MAKKKIEVEKGKKDSLYVLYEESRSGGGLQEGEEGPYGSRETEEIFFEITGVSAKDPKMLHQQLEEIDFKYTNQDLFILVIRYDTGNTFGRSLNHWYLEGVYEDVDFTKKVIKTLEAGHKAFDRTNWGKKKEYVKYTKLKNLESTYIYGAWEGYFERLAGFEIYLIKNGVCIGK